MIPVFWGNISSEIEAISEETTRPEAAEIAGEDTAFRETTGFPAVEIPLPRKEVKLFPSILLPPLLLDNLVKAKVHVIQNNITKILIFNL
mmetsp:Transcript_13647/g.20782  ORF Transcript_13647/g.20782 Transcript_13647/m.20782 type:complete len:90 (+) Transcript_13647:1332-1601(+)